MKIEVIALPKDARSELVRQLIRRSYARLPPHWVNVIPPTEVRIVTRGRLEKMPLRQWNSNKIGLPSLAGWSVRVVSVSESAQCVIQVFYGASFTRPSSAEINEYLFIKAMISALLVGAYSQKFVSTLVIDAAARYQLFSKFRPEQLWSDAVPGFIVDRAEAVKSQPFLNTFFDELDRKISKI